MYKINITKHLILSISFCFIITNNILASSSNTTISGFEKVKTNTINDYYDYLDRVGAIKEEETIGPDAYIKNQNNNIINNANNIYNPSNNSTIISYAIAKDTNNNEFQGQLVGDGNNTKFVFIDGYNKQQYFRGWIALNMTTGQKGWYHFDNEGNMSIGFYRDNNNTYYFIEHGINKGMMATGQLNINGKIYNFSDEAGASYGILIQ